LGVLAVKDFYDAMSVQGTADLKAITQDVPIVSDLSNAISVIQAIRTSPVHMVLVFDEYGHFEGVISSGDIMEAIMGALQDGPIDEQAIARRDDGSYLVSGWTPIDEFAEFMSLKLGDDLEYQTVAGLVLEELKHLPVLGESFTKDGWRFEVIDLDGRRIDKILVSSLDTRQTADVE
jgi:putative hemolysin